MPRVVNSPRRPQIRRSGVHRWAKAPTEFTIWPIALAGVLLILQLGGLLNLVEDPPAGPDYFAAAKYVETSHEAGDPIIVAIPPPVFLALKSPDDMYFLPGPLDAPRAQRYTRHLDSGQYVDYWLGIPSIVSVNELCDVLVQSPTSWLIVDEIRLNSPAAYFGPMADLIRGATSTTYTGDGGVTVRRPKETGSWTEAATSSCAADPYVDSGVPLGLPHVAE